MLTTGCACEGVCRQLDLGGSDLANGLTLRQIQNSFDEERERSCPDLFLSLPYVCFLSPMKVLYHKAPAPLCSAQKESEE